MTIKTTPKQIGEAMFAIGQLKDAGSVPVKAAYAVGKLARVCQAEMEDYQKARDKIFTDAGCILETVKDASGKVVKNKDGSDAQQYVHPEGREKLDPVVKVADELADAEVELNALPLDIELFKDCEVPGGSFLGLDWAMKPETPAA